MSVDFLSQQDALKMLSEMKSFINEKSSSYIKEKIDKIRDINQDRKEMFFNLLTEENNRLRTYSDFDVTLYAISIIDEDFFKKLNVKRHCESHSDSMEYDPRKNGENIIRHGISLRESIGCNRFGTLIINAYSEKDKRSAYFSDINMSMLELPIPETMHHKFTLTVAENKYPKIRIISVRTFGKKGYKKVFNKGLLGDIYENEVNKEEKVEEFKNNCCNIIENQLFPFAGE